MAKRKKKPQKCGWPWRAHGENQVARPVCEKEATEPVFDGPMFTMACKRHCGVAQQWVNKKRKEFFAREEARRQDASLLRKQAEEIVIKRLTRGGSLALARFAASFMFRHHGVTDKDAKTLAAGRTPRRW